MTDNQEVEILIVEDDPADAELTIRTLKKQKLANNLIHLEDGAKALDFIFGRGEFSRRNINRMPKVILLDLKMPKVSGLEVLEKLKQDPQMRSIPIVILTSSAEHPDVKKAYDLGANSYIVKPVNFNDFSKTINGLGMYWMVVNKAII